MRKREERERRPCENKEEIEVTQPQAKNDWSHQKLGEARLNSLLKSRGSSTALLTS